MPDEIDLANEHAAKHLALALKAHRATMANRPPASATECVDCGEDIPEERQKKARGCTRCISCQTDFERGR